MAQYSYSILLARAVGIGLVRFHATKCVIDNSVMSLICSDDQNDITHHCILLCVFGEAGGECVCVCVCNRLTTKVFIGKLSAAMG